jgi:GT2 family glycosyltransferase
MIFLTQALLWALWLPTAACCLYLLLLTLRSAAPVAPPPASRRVRFDVIVPAHNEEAHIARTVASLRKLDWPHDHFRLYVVADNCTDDTALHARASGAHVIERDDPLRRGKGYALQLAFRTSGQLAWADAVVVVDADSEVSPNLLDAFAARIEAGADAVQARYGVLNPHASWRTRLITVAKACFHIVRSRAREVSELSCGIRGNGWCVTHCLLAEVPYAAFSLVEDVEYGVALALAGHRVHYADEAEVRGEMASASRAAASQRQRWEGGREALKNSQLRRLFGEAWHYADAVCLDLAIDLLVPPLSQIGVRTLGFAALSATAALLQPALVPMLALPAFCAFALGAYVVRGWQLSGMGLSGITALLHTPRFVLWKLRLALHAPGNGEWIRTERDDPSKAAP